MNEAIHVYLDILTDFDFVEFVVEDFAAHGGLLSASTAAKYLEANGEFQDPDSYCKAIMLQGEIQFEKWDWREAPAPAVAVKRGKK